jgi:DNA-binding NarL/FixJ family response regulator
MRKRPNLNQPRIRILLVDGHRLMRDGIRLSLEQEPEMEVVGDAGDGATALRLASELCPDLVVMDIGLPDGDGVGFSREILRQHPDTRIVIHTGAVDREHLDGALAAGIRNYVLQGEAASELHTAILRAMRRKTYLSQDVVAALVDSYEAIRAGGEPHEHSLLSERETTILTFMADGCNTKQIAEKLGCSVKTVDYYRKRLMSKACVHSVAELTKYAIRKGLTTP